MATYYIDSIAGSDSNNGTTTGTPWKTIAKVNSSMGSFHALDSVLFKRGSVFTQELVVNTGGTTAGQVTFGAYGSGPQPLFTGFTTVSSWTNLGGGVWESTAAVSTLPTCTVVLINGIQYAMGRYPATTAGYLNISAVTGTITTGGSITTGSTIPTTYVGGTLVTKTKHWIIENQETITAQTGSTFLFGIGYSNYPNVGWGFFVQNHPSTLAKFGDWYYNPTTFKLRIYFGAFSPGSYTIRCSTVDTMINSISSYNTFDSLNITGANSYGITSLSDPKYGIQVTNNTVTYCGVNGIYLAGMNSGLVQYNNVSYCNNGGIFANYHCYNCSILNNNIDSIGLLAGAGKGGGYTGITAASDGAIIKYNNVTNCGYTCITSGGTGCIVQYNYVNNYCSITDDGGGIYIECTGSSVTVNLVDHNVVLNGVGVNAGTNNLGAPLAHGIYFDYPSTGYTCSNNTIVNAPYSGIFVHGNINFSLNANSIYNCTYAIFAQYGGSLATVHGGSITNNLLFANLGQLCLFYQSLSTTSDIAGVGVFDNNVYSRPTSDTNTIRYAYNNGLGGSFYSLSTWKAAFPGYDTHSTITPTSTIVSLITPYINTTNASMGITLAGTYKDLKGTVYSGTITLAPYSSLLLLTTIAASQQGRKQITV